MPSEMLMLREMLSGNYIPIVVLTGLFVALLFRRDAINSPGMFRWGYLFFIASLILPSLIQVYLSAAGAPAFPRNGYSTEGGAFAIISCIAPVFSALGLTLILSSLMPRPKPSATARSIQPLPAAPPQKHPLDP